MKTYFTLLTVAFAATFTIAAVASSLGFSIPSTFDASRLFAGYVAAAAAMIAFADYTPRRVLVARRAAIIPLCESSRPSCAGANRVAA